MQYDKYNVQLDYDRKWVLYQRHDFDKCFESAFVHWIRDGVVKYSPEGNPRGFIYVSVDRLQKLHAFFPNPVQMPPPPADDRTGSIPDRTDTCHGVCPFFEDLSGVSGVTSGGQTASTPQAGGSDTPACEHVWSESMCLSLPPIYRRECRKCGKVQEYRPESPSPDKDIYGVHPQWKDVN